MRTEVYTCDICKQSKGRDDLAKITIKSEGIRMKGVGYNGIMVDICPDCLKKKGFIVEFKEEDMEPALMQNKQTLEDKVFEILSDLGVVFEE
nr:MAG TPA: spire-like protein [Caudoviricetes sp.]